jgi:hypothetical protein
VADIEEERRGVDHRFHLAKRRPDLDRHFARRSTAFQGFDVIVELGRHDHLHHQAVQKLLLAAGSTRHACQRGRRLHRKRQVLVPGKEEPTDRLQRLELPVGKTITFLEVTEERSVEDLLDIDTLTDEQLAMVGGGQGMTVL